MGQMTRVSEVNIEAIVWWVFLEKYTRRYYSNVWGNCYVEDVVFDEQVKKEQKEVKPTITSLFNSYQRRTKKKKPIFV